MCAHSALTAKSKGRDLMSGSGDRIIPVELICSTLWSGMHLSMTTELADAYIRRLDSLELLEMAADQTQAHGAPGGVDDDSTDKHLALRFTNSVGRNLCAILDPHSSLHDVSNSILSPLLGDKVLLVDAPCGAGASGLALLDSIRELRAKKVLVALPLSVHIVAGDISGRAREHYRHLFNEMTAGLADMQIYAELSECEWDVSDVASNAEFVDHTVEAAAKQGRALVIASNFSHAMTDEDLSDSFKQFLSQIVGRLAPWPTNICWIEPTSNKAKKFFTNLATWVAKHLRLLKEGHIDRLECAYKMWDPVANKAFESGISILRRGVSN